MIKDIDFAPRPISWFIGELNPDKWGPSTGILLRFKLNSYKPRQLWQLRGISAEGLDYFDGLKTASTRIT